MPHKLDIGVVDEKGKESSVSVWLPSGFTLAQYQTFSNTFVTRLAAIIVGGILKSKLCVEVPINAISQTGKPNALSDVEEVGEYIFLSADGFRTMLNLPAYDEVHTQPASDAIDTALADPLALINAMVDGILLDDAVTTVQPTDAGGEDITSLVSARERYRNSGKRRK